MNDVVVTVDLFTALLNSRQGGADAFEGIGKEYGWEDVEPLTVFDHWDRQNKELHAQQGQRGTWHSFRELSTEALSRTYQDLRLAGDPAEDAQVVLGSVPQWKPWPDSIDGLTMLQSVAAVGVLSNVDSDILANTAVKEHLDPSHLYTSDRWHAYKPAPAIYTRTRDEIASGGGIHMHIASSARDLMGASAAGMAVIGLRRDGIAPPDGKYLTVGVIRSLPEAVGLVREWSATGLAATRGSFE